MAGKPKRKDKWVVYDECDECGAQRLWDGNEFKIGCTCATDYSDIEEDDDLAALKEDADREMGLESYR